MKKILVALIIFFILGVSSWIFWHYFKNTPLAKTLQEPKKRFSFVVFGDNEGVNPIIEKIIDDIPHLDVDFVVSVADVTPHGTEEQYNAVSELFQKFTVPFYTVIGNNDLNRPISRDLFYSHFHNPTYYSFDYDNTHFVMLDNADRKVGFDEQQLDWLEKDLAQNTKEHTFLLYHRPFDLPFSDILGDDETKASRITNERFLEIIKPHTITRIFNGHLHMYYAYHLQNIPVTITGGAGALPQEILGGESSAYYHYILVTVTDSGIETKVVEVK